MHSNRDAKRIARRGELHLEATSAIVDPQELSVYRVSTEKIRTARQICRRSGSELSAGSHRQTKTIIQMVSFLKSPTSPKLLRSIL